MASSDSSLDGRDTFEKIAASFLEAYRRGERPDISDLANQYPSHADQLRELLPTLLLLEDLTPVHDEVAPQSTLGDFRILREIARGGMGVVYEAEQLSLNRKVALKVLPFAAMLDSRQRERFVVEAHAAATLHHTNIVPVYGTGCERGVHYFAMQYIDGESLDKVVTELRHQEAVKKEGSTVGQLADDTASTVVSHLLSQRSENKNQYFRAIVQIGVQVADAIEHAHRDGIIHRDVKPSNLILDTDGKVWLSDFGLARINRSSTLTMTGDVVGTLRYMSPEQALGKPGVVDHRSDIYSLGATIYELLTLRPIRADGDREQVLRQIALDEPLPLRRFNDRIPIDLETIVLKATATDPGDRYRSAAELAADMRSFLVGKPIQAKRPTLLDRAFKLARRHKGIAASIFVLLTLSATLTSVFSLVLAQKQKELVSERDAAVEQRELAIAHRSQGLAVFSDIKKLYEESQPSNRRWLEIELRFLRRELDFYRVAIGASGQDSREIVHTLAKVQQRIAVLHYWLGDPKEALSVSTEALSRFQWLTNDTATPELLRELAVQHHDHGDILVSLNRNRDAAEHFEKSANTLRSEPQLKKKHASDLLKWEAKKTSALADRGRAVVADVKQFTAPVPNLAKNPTFLTFGPDVNADGNPELFATTLDQHSVVQFDGKSGRFLSTFVAVGSGGLVRPTGLAFGADGNNDGIPELLVASWSTNSIMRYDGLTGKPLPATGKKNAVFVESGSDGLEFPEMIHSDLDGNLLVATGRSGRILRFHQLTGKYLGDCISADNRLRKMTSFCFGTTGNGRKRDLFMAVPRSDAVLLFDYEKGSFTEYFVPKRYAGLHFPRGLAFGPDNHLYVVSQDTGELLRFQGTTGAFLDIVAKDLPNPHEVATDKFGDIYISCHARGGGFITKITFKKSP